MNFVFTHHVRRPTLAHTCPGIGFKGNFATLLFVVISALATAMNPLEKTSRLQVQFKNYLFAISSHNTHSPKVSSSLSLPVFVFFNSALLMI